MAIDKWEAVDRPDHARVLAEMEEARRRTELRRQREQEALAWQRKTKAEKESAQLWAWYESDFDVADSFAARDRARESQRQQLLKQEIGAELLAAEVEKAVSEMSDA